MQNGAVRLLAVAALLLLAAPAAAQPPPAPAPGPVTFAFGGDVIFESPIDSYAPGEVLAPMRRILSRADVAMVNLETPVSERGTPIGGKQYVFRAPLWAFDALRRGGVDVVTVANNHGMDYGPVAMRDTLRNAAKAGMPVVGGGLDEAQAFTPWRTFVNGQWVAVLGATQVIDEELLGVWEARGNRVGVASAKYDMEDRLVRAVRQARRANDTVVVYLHWGEELKQCPLDRQVALARRLTGAGADIVVGSHAHVLLGGGLLGRAFVDYGLGNFVFYQDGGVVSQTGVVEVTATGRHIDGYRFVPAQISGALPRPIASPERVDAWNALRACTGLRR